MPSAKKARRRRAIGAREESTSITGQVASPPLPSTETNDEATSSQHQSLIESQNVHISDGQFNQIRSHYTNIVLNVNPTSENTLTIQGSQVLCLQTKPIIPVKAQLLAKVLRIRYTCSFKLQFLTSNLKRELHRTREEARLCRSGQSCLVKMSLLDLTPPSVDLRPLVQ